MTFLIEWDEQRVPSAFRLGLLRRRRIERAVGEALRSRAKGEISVAFVSAPMIRRLNRTYRHKDTITDVLSFRISSQLAQVVVCVARAKKQAREHGWSVTYEMVDLVLHGILHTFGFDHKTTRQAKRMLSLQETLRERVC